MTTDEIFGSLYALSLFIAYPLVVGSVLITLGIIANKIIEALNK